MRFFSFHLMPYIGLDPAYDGPAWVTCPNTLYDPAVPTTPLTTATTKAKPVIATTPPTPAPPPPTPPPPTPVSASIDASPRTLSSTGGPFLTVLWSSSGGSTVVSGPGMTSSTAASGSQTFCPGRSSGTTCFAMSASYTYTITVTGSSTVTKAVTVSVR